MTHAASDGLAFPLIIEPTGSTDVSSGSLIAWCRDRLDELRDALLRHGAILFRGFNVTTAQALSAVAASQSRQLLSYIDGNSPRTRLSNDVYTSTEYPADDTIWLHNELSYARCWPARLFLCCATPAPEGGETPITDGRHLLRVLPPDIVEAFARKGVCYVRNLHGGVGLGPSWQDTFETDDPRRVEAHLVEDGAEFAWQGDGMLRIQQRRPGIIAHPVTGEQAWFNQADQFHPSGLRPEAYEAMQLLFAEDVDRMPINATFGDGSAIPPAMLQTIRTTALREAAILPWQQGDVMMLDNVLTMHGRRPYRGTRQVLVCMA